MREVGSMFGEYLLLVIALNYLKETERARVDLNLALTLARE